MRKALLLVAASATALSPIAVSAQSARYLDPREVAEAQREHAQLVEEMGGAETGPRAAYVNSVGQRVAAYSGVANPGQTFRFTTLNSAVENAMAVPGGYVYITRQLMALMDDEAQLAFALAHEAGHIADNHHRQRRAVQSRNSVYQVLGAIFGSVLGSSAIGNLLSQGAQLRTLSFSREQENRADTLGLRYIMAAGYDPAGGPGVLAALSRATALQARVQGRTNRQTPEWASTHPLSETRTRLTLQQAQQSGRLGTGMRNRDQFLAQLNGVFVDDDPAQGVIDGRLFTHPDLRIQFAVPTGYLMQNSTTDVTIAGSAGKAQFSGGRYNGDLNTYAYRVLQALMGERSQIQAPPPQRTTINGIPAAITMTRTQTQSGVMDVGVVAYQWDANTVYHFVTLTQGGAGLNPFASMINSLRRISASEAAAIRPRVIQVATVRAGETVQTLAARMAYPDFKLERFLSLNGLNTASRLTPGQKVKLVVHGTRRA